MGWGLRNVLEYWVVAVPLDGQFPLIRPPSHPVSERLLGNWDLTFPKFLTQKGVMKHESLIHSGPWGAVTFKGSSGAPPADGLSPLHLCWGPQQPLRQEFERLRCDKTEVQRDKAQVLLTPATPQGCGPELCPGWSRGPYQGRGNTGLLTAPVSPILSIPWPGLILKEVGVHRDIKGRARGSLGQGQTGPGR